MKGKKVLLFRRREVPRQKEPRIVRFARFLRALKKEMPAALGSDFIGQK